MDMPGVQEANAPGPASIPGRQESAPKIESVSWQPAFRPLYWAGVPALALVAYAAALRIGFLADDYVMVFEARHGLQWQTYMPSKYWIFYRPVGRLLVWDIPSRLWGYNPLPYHIGSLLVHAAVALVLGLWLAQATGRHWLGWLAGALFAVFPLHTEAVGWLAGQWDAWALLFGLLSLWAFTRWWREGQLWLYMLALLFYALGLYTKENMLAWLPVLPVGIWFVSLSLRRINWRRLLLSMLPFAAVLGFCVFQRFSTWGRIGGYPQARSDYLHFFWDTTIEYARVLLAPISAVVAGTVVQQVVGAVSCALVLLALIRYGWENRRLLLLAVLWLAITVVPVLNLEVHASDLVNNRFLYIPAAGYCIALAVLVSAVLANARRWRAWGVALLAASMAASIVAATLNLSPWHTATVQVQNLGLELHRLIPPHAHPGGLKWYVTDVPDTYKGATVLIIGLDRLRYFDTGEELQLRFPQAPDPFPFSAAMLNDYSKNSRSDMFAMRFAYNPPDDRFHPVQIAGVTSISDPPARSEGGSDLAVWDFRSCAGDSLRAWQALNTTEACEQGKGLTISHSNGDPQLVGPKINMESPGRGPGFVRLRVCLRLPSVALSADRAGQWFWETPDAPWSADRNAGTMSLHTDGDPHVYWTYIPFSRVPHGITRLRFDPTDDFTPAEVQWIAADLVR